MCNVDKAPSWLSFWSLCCSFEGFVQLVAPGFDCVDTTSVRRFYPFGNKPCTETTTSVEALLFIKFFTSILLIKSADACYKTARAQCN